VHAVETAAPAELSEAVLWRLTHSGYEHFVTSFNGFDSLEGADDVKLWQVYGDDGRGVALIFNVQRLLKEVNEGAGPYVIAPVRYGLADLHCLVLRLVSRAVPHWHAETDSVIRTQFGFTMGEAIQRLCAFFKDPCFSYEREVRALRINPYPDEVKFYDRGTFEAPYIEMPLRLSTAQSADLFNAQLTGSLVHCLIGPSTDQQRVQAVLASTLFHKWHTKPGDAIGLSRIPYRSVRTP
jgi:hypothetical protein